MERANTQSRQHALRGMEAGGVGLPRPVGLMGSRGAAAQSTMARSGEHPSGAHTALSGDLWMVDHNGATVLRCWCLAVSATRMRLCVPAGYGVAVGQRYELSARGAGENPFSPRRAIVSFWVTVVQTQSMTDEDPDRIDVAVAVDQIARVPIYTLPGPRA